MRKTEKKLSSVLTGIIFTMQPFLPTPQLKRLSVLNNIITEYNVTEF